MANAKSGKSKQSLIDPIYQKYTRSVIRALGSTEFYEFFMDAVSKADNEFQFSNRKTVKTVDLGWVDAIEDTLSAFQSVITSPRNVIREEELIVNVANAKKAGSDVVRHLAQHASLVEKFDPDKGEVRPSKLMQKFREDSTSTLYENRLVYTALEEAYQFVKIRHDALFTAMSDEFGAKLRVNSNMETSSEQVHMEMFMHIKEIEGALETDEKNRDVFERISRIYRVLSVHMNSQFAQSLSRQMRVKGSITKTNILKKNPNYRKIMQLLEYLRGYDDIGYTIRVVEQNPTIDENLQQDIYHNILFNYLVLKGYLEDEKDRQVPAPTKSKQRALKPKFIKQIIEELTEDYDLPDVEIRKVLIEELTKEQLMQEEAAERRRLVEEQAQRKKEEQERLKKEREAERERLRQAREAEKERLRREKEAEEQRLFQERMEREAEDRRRCRIFQAELDRFAERLPQLLEAREEAAAKKEAELRAFEEAIRRMEEEERAREAEARMTPEEREQLRLEKEKAEQEERERREQELKEKREKQRMERLARIAEELKLRREEEERQALLLKQQQEQEERERREQEEKDTAAVKIYVDEITVFVDGLPQRLKMRQDALLEAQQEELRHQQERQNRTAVRRSIFRR